MKRLRKEQRLLSKKKAEKLAKKLAKNGETADSKKQTTKKEKRQVEIDEEEFTYSTDLWDYEDS